MGSKVRLNQGTGLFLEHHFTEVNKKFFVGGQLSIQQYKIEKDFYDGDEKFTNALIMGYGGYTLQPFEFPLYFKLWGGIGYNNKISGSNELGDIKYYQNQSEITNINHFSNENLFISPNPFTHELSIYIGEKKSDNQNLRINIFNSTGSMVYQTSISPKHNNHIKLPNLTSGSYIIQLKSGNNAFIKKLICKQNR
jgi:hypothetical protein